MAVSDYVVAAICGCWYRESHVNPGIWESLKVKSWDYVYGTDGSNQGGYGLGQFTNTQQSGGVSYRLLDLYNWMTANGYAMTDGYGQCYYMVNVEKVWILNDTTYSTLAAFLSSTSTDLDNLVRIFLANWEGVPGNALTERQGHASRFLKYIQQNKNKTGFGWHYGNTYDLGGGYTTLSSSTYGSLSYSNNSLANVMMVWQFFNGYAPEEPEEPDPEEPLPEGYHRITVNITGNGTAFAKPNQAASDTIITLYEYDSTEYQFQGWTVVAGGVTISDDNTFTMPDEDVIINAVFGGYTPEYPDPTPVPKVRAKSPWIFYIPWWRKYGL